MSKFKMHSEFIGNKEIEVITDEEGIKWYPLNFFMKRILFKPDKMAKFRDSYASKHMRVIDCSTGDFGTYRNRKTWYINEKGLKYILKKITIFGANSTQSMYRLREKSLVEAREYFKVEAEEPLTPKFINQMPNLDNYDIWSKLCIESDRKIRGNSNWQLCSNCGYYYPATMKYFKRNKKDILQDTCLQCLGKDFICSNHIVQYIKDLDGMELLYQLDKNNEKKVMEELKNFILKGE